jgi:hypothetical protein
MEETTTTIGTEVEVNLAIFTNKDRDISSYQLLQLFYNGAFENTIGLMRAKNKITGEDEQLLVGMSVNDNGLVDTWPLAKILTPDDVPRYLSPDGKGGWYGVEIDVCTAE